MVNIRLSLVKNSSLGDNSRHLPSAILQILTTLSSWRVTQRYSEVERMNLAGDFTIQPSSSFPTFSFIDIDGISNNFGCNNKWKKLL
jgi:hypothetical protein